MNGSSSDRDSCPARDALEHAAEQLAVNRNQRVPVGATDQATRIERGGLTNDGSAPFDISDLELQPGPAWQLPVGGKPKPPVRLKCLHRPAVDEVSNRAQIRITSPTTHADTAEPAVERPAHAP